MHDNRSILICDDEAMHASLIRWFLRRRGIGNPILHFSRGKLLLDYLRTTPDTQPPPALIFLDIRMPEMDGMEVLKAIKNSPQTTRIPVVMLTTVNEPEDISMCQQLGSASYLTKPISDQVLVSVVRQLLDSKGSLIREFIGEVAEDRKPAENN